MAFSGRGGEGRSQEGLISGMPENRRTPQDAIVKTAEHPK